MRIVLAMVLSIGLVACEGGGFTVPRTAVGNWNPRNDRPNVVIDVSCEPEYCLVYQGDDLVLSAAACDTLGNPIASGIVFYWNHTPDLGFLVDPASGDSLPPLSTGERMVLRVDSTAVGQYSVLCMFGDSTGVQSLFNPEIKTVHVRIPVP